MPSQKGPSPEALADKLLRQWAAKVAAAEGRDVGEVLREAGILDRRMQRVVRDRELPLSMYNRYREGREEQND